MVGWPLLYFFKKQNLKPDEGRAMYVDSVIILIPVPCVYVSVIGEVSPLHMEELSASVAHYASKSWGRLLINVPLL